MVKPTIKRIPGVGVFSIRKHGRQGSERYVAEVDLHGQRVASIQLGEAAIEALESKWGDRTADILQEELQDLLSRIEARSSADSAD